MTFPETEFLNNFLMLGSSSERFNYLIALGEELPPMPEELKITPNRILACTSRTYFTAFFIDGKLQINGWSNAAVPGGIIAMLHTVYQGATRQETAGIEEFIRRTDLLSNLTPTRQEALKEMITRILF